MKDHETSNGGQNEEIKTEWDNMGGEETAETEEPKESNITERDVDYFKNNPKEIGALVTELIDLRGGEDSIEENATWDKEQRAYVDKNGVPRDYAHLTGYLKRNPDAIASILEEYQSLKEAANSNEEEGPLEDVSDYADETFTSAENAEDATKDKSAIEDFPLMTPEEYAKKYHPEHIEQAREEQAEKEQKALRKKIEQAESERKAREREEAENKRILENWNNALAEQDAKEKAEADEKARMVERAKAEVAKKKEPTAEEIEDAYDLIGDRRPSGEENREEPKQEASAEKPENEASTETISESERAFMNKFSDLADRIPRAQTFEEVSVLEDEVNQLIEDSSMAVKAQIMYRYVHREAVRCRNVLNDHKKHLEKLPRFTFPWSKKHKEKKRLKQLIRQDQANLDRTEQNLQDKARITQPWTNLSEEDRFRVTKIEQVNEWIERVKFFIWSESQQQQAQNAGDQHRAA